MNKKNWYETVQVMLGVLRGLFVVWNISISDLTLANEIQEHNATTSHVCEVSDQRHSLFHLHVNSLSQTHTHYMYTQQNFKHENLWL